MRTILRELRASLTRNASMTVSLVVTMTVSLLLAAVGLLIQSQADLTESYYGDRLQIQVMLCSDVTQGGNCLGQKTTPEQEAQIKQILTASPEVKKVEYRTQKQNYDAAKALYSQSDQTQVQLQSLTETAFPATFLVTLKDPNKYDGVQSQLQGQAGVNKTLSLRQTLAPLFEALSKLRWAALGTSLVLIVAAILQVSNTIRMTAFARRREIGIMRLVGASSWHIQLPFLLESLVAAAISAALASVLLSGFMYSVVYGYFHERLGEITVWVGWGDALVVMGWTSLLAVVLALVPTLVMTRKYLNV